MLLTVLWSWWGSCPCCVLQRAGLIPEAGLLKSATAGEPDEYVDAIVFHKTFAK